MGGLKFCGRHRWRTPKALSKADTLHWFYSSSHSIWRGREKKLFSSQFRPANQTASLAGCEISICICAGADTDTQGTQKDTVRCCGLAAEEQVFSRMCRLAVWLAGFAEKFIKAQGSEDFGKEGFEIQVVLETLFLIQFLKNHTLGAGCTYIHCIGRLNVSYSTQRPIKLCMFMKRVPVG